MKLSEYMRERDLSPDALAAMLGDVSASGVRKWANEERVPRKDQVERIADITGGLVMPNDFYSIPEFPAGPAASQAGTGRSEEVA